MVLIKPIHTQLFIMKKLFLALFLFVSVSTFCQQKVVIVPQPVSMQIHDGNFNLSKTTAIVASKNDMHEATMLNVYLKKLYGITLPVKASTAGTSQGNAIIFKLLSSGKKDEYNLVVNTNEITISSASNEGLFYGLQTLLQLLPETNERIDNGFSIPAVTIDDYPRFQYRGMHLDVGRHFFGVDFIKKYLDYLAYHKYNTFHWHLTEDQGWRIEIKRYPRLTSVGAYRNGTIIGHYPGTGNDSIHYGGFYTQEQIKEVVKYAQDRFITIIPEIEMPGHASAAIAAYPKLSCFPDQSTEISPRVPWAGSRVGKQVQQAWGVFPDVFCPSEYTFTFIENVLDEVMKLFPSKYIHIGGDECPKTY